MGDPRFATKGTHVVQVMDWVDARRGPGTFMNLVRAVDPDWPERVSPINWYPLRPILKVVRGSLEGDETVESVFRDIAAQNAEHDLENTYKAFSWVSRPAELFKMLERVFGSYANFGTIEVETNEDGHCVASLLWLEEDLVDWAAGTMVGFIPVAARVTGGKNPEAKLLERGPKDTRWAIRFECRYEL